MSGRSTNFKSGESREVLFWFLLLASWQLLASTSTKAGIVGGLGAATFLSYAWANLDQLRGLGLNFACWRSAARANWMTAAASGVVAGIVVFAIGSASGQAMRLADNWQLFALQVTLGPVLEEVIFRGYLFAFSMWLLNRVVSNAARQQHVAVLSTAVVFALVHLTQPGVSWLQLACIMSTGTLYGWIRCRSGSTAPAAFSHALYNLTLYGLSGAVLLGHKALRSG